MNHMADTLDLINQLPEPERCNIQMCELAIWDLVRLYGRNGRIAAQVVGLSILEEERELKAQ
jgi:hypothetical protein